LAVLILLSSLFHFCDTQSKTEDHCFVGFPAIWNIVAFYVFALQMPTRLAGVLVLVCVLLTFVPLRWAHPLRTPTFWPMTLGVVVLWCAAAALVLWSGFPAAPYLQVILCLAAAYGIVLALVRRGAW
jgi:phosphatidylcholine synthase